MRNSAIRKASLVVAVMLGSCRPGPPTVAPPDVGPAPRDTATPPPVASAAPLAAPPGSAAVPPPLAPPVTLEERLRAPLLSADGRVVAFLPTSYHGDSGGILALLDVATDRVTRYVSTRGVESADVERARIAEAMDLVDGLRASALAVHEMDTDPTTRERAHGLGFSSPMRGTGEGLRVRFHEPVLLVDDAGGRPLVRRAFPRWSARAPGCFVYADLGQSWGNRGRGVLVVQIRYSGSPHSCAENPSMHVVRVQPER